jgi:hypothetical protein
MCRYNRSLHPACLRKYSVYKWNDVVCTYSNIPRDITSVLMCVITFYHCCPQNSTFIEIVHVCNMFQHVVCVTWFIQRRFFGLFFHKLYTFRFASLVCPLFMGESDFEIIGGMFEATYSLLSLDSSLLVNAGDSTANKILHSPLHRTL